MAFGVDTGDLSVTACPVMAVTVGRPLETSKLRRPLHVQGWQITLWPRSVNLLAHFLEATVR
jgi:hypothetical protein